MLSRERQSVPKPAGSNGIDLGFKVGIGFYLGLVVAGFATIGGIAVDASTATLLATAPSTVTGVLLVTLVFGNRLEGVPERLGQNRLRRSLWYLPAVAFAAVPLAAWLVQITLSPQLAATAAGFAIITVAIAIGLSQMTRNRFIAAVTGEPTVEWTWQTTRFDGPGWSIAIVGSGVLFVLAGLQAAFSEGGSGARLLGYGSILLLLWVGQRREWGAFEQPEADSRWGGATLQAYDAGLVVDRFNSKLIPWDRIGTIELTDEELVIERNRWFDVRCDRDAIDDPEGALERVERVRSREIDAPRQ
ncbi:hypothetical protein [Natronorubrum daqingense]|uniref:PH domain-containing protein n=1 Tax=Natronorubrum daqingense TaxID=588898 RepID=A0A1N6ZRT9_9EURY|nr:hypothetical protein [Natronorubrum daqingense]APX95270.1 hypothetical protein BB347_00855 [Natronorubrum daqingense]SIR29580.1 hypothetical protein SAMN05421809_0893 [Natronorubrum daqingense]